MEKKESSQKNIPNIIRENDSVQINNLSIERIKELKGKNIIPEEHISRFLKEVVTNNIISQKFYNFFQKKPQASAKVINEFIKDLKNKLELKFEDEHSVQFQDSIIKNWDECLSIWECGSNNRMDLGLFKGVNNENYFGVSRSIVDPMDKLKPLLQDAKIILGEDNKYKIRGETHNSYGNTIAIEYHLETNKKDEAEEALLNYKNTMNERGLKIWLGYWKTAGEYRDTTFSCPMIEIMKNVSNEKRECKFFAVKEKTEHWTITQMLSRTTLKIEIETSGGTKKWIEQRLLEILGGEQNGTDKYPFKIAVRILNAQEKFFPAIFSNTTLRLHHKDTYLAYHIQARSSQHGKGSKLLKLDWIQLFHYGNMEKTVKKNERTAKTRTRKKLERLKSKGVFETWEEIAGGVVIKPKNHSTKT